MDLNLDIGLLIWTLITFAGLLAVLSRFAWKPLCRLLDERQDMISSSIEEARAGRDEARKLVLENEEKMRQAREEMHKIVEEGHKLSEEIRGEAREKAGERTAAMIEEARREIERETKKSLEELKATVAGLAVRVSRQVIGENLDEKRHEQIADEFIEKLRKSRDNKRS
jgi:F-type H+-transporting ATPase subunit b